MCTKNFIYCNLEEVSLWEPKEQFGDLQYAGDWHPHPSPQPTPGSLAVATDVRIPLSDGITLSCDILRPQIHEPIPALISWSPYGRNLAFSGIPSFKNECGVGVARFGYAHVVINKRGTHLSDGTIDIWFSPQERKDLVEAIAWVAQQPWCNGQIGMIGVSYFSMSQLIAAAEHPPALKALFVYDFSTDIHRHIFYYGGDVNSTFLNLYAATARGHAKTTLSYRIQCLLRYLFQYRWLVKRVPTLLRTMAGHLVRRIHTPPVFLRLYRECLAHRYDHDHFYSRLISIQDVEQISLPICIGATPSSISLHQFGSYDLWHRASSTQKYLFIGPRDDIRPWSSFHYEAFSWYDFQLKGIENGYRSLPRVRYWVEGQNTWESAEDWPLPQAQKVSLFLYPRSKEASAAQGLSTEPQGGDPLSYFAIPTGFDPPRDCETVIPEVLSYRTDPRTTPWKIVGPVHLHLKISSNALDTFLIARISDLAPDGSIQKLSFGCLLASSRKINGQHSTPTEIVHDTYPPEPLIPYQPVTLAWSLTPLLHVFRPGHSLILDVASRSDRAGFNADEPYVYFQRCTPPYAAVNTVYHDADSFLMLDQISN